MDRITYQDYPELTFAYAAAAVPNAVPPNYPFLVGPHLDNYSVLESTVQIKRMDHNTFTIINAEDSLSLIIHISFESQKCQIRCKMKISGR